MKTLIIALAGTSLAAGLFVSAAPAEAGPFDRLRSAVEDVEDAAEDAEDAAEAAETVRDVATGNRSSRSNRRSSRGSGFANRGSTSASARTARAPDHAGSAGAPPARFMQQTTCANINQGNAFVGQAGDYTFSQGISTQSRSGIVTRTPTAPESGCFFGGLGVGDVLYLEVDRSKYNRGSHRIQCVSYDGSEQLSNTNGPNEGGYSGKDVMLHTGNSLGFTPTASGSNSDRGRAYDDYLEGRGREMLTFNFAALHTDRSGTDFFCQWFNNSTGESAVAFAFRRGPAG